MVDRTTAADLAAKYFRHYLNRYRCSIDQVEEHDTHWLLCYSSESLDDASAMPICNCWLIIDKTTGMVCIPRVRTQRSDIAQYPENRDLLPCVDVRQFDG